MKLPQVRINTATVLIAIAALSLTVAIQAIQSDKACRREAVLRGRLKQMAVDVRDATNPEVKIRDGIVLGLFGAKRSKTDPEVVVAMADLLKARTAFNARVDQLKSLR